MISFKVSQLDLIALKLNNVKISNNTIMIVLIAKGTQGRSTFKPKFGNKGHICVVFAVAVLVAKGP